jgi:hypothetical protein
VSNLKWGEPLIPRTEFGSEEEQDKEKSKGRDDETRKYPSDTDYIIAMLTDIMEHVDKTYKEGDTGVKIRIDGLVMTIDELLAVAMSDAMKAVFSMAFVFLYLFFHMQSCLLAALGMGIIALSFPFTAVITNGIL